MLLINTTLDLELFNRYFLCLSMEIPSAQGLGIDTNVAPFINGILSIDGEAKSKTSALREFRGKK